MSFKSFLAKSVCLLACTILTFSAGCTTGGGGTNGGGDGTVEAGKTGWYVLTKKTVEDVDLTAQFIYNAIELKKDGKAVLYEADFAGLSQKEATYETDGEYVNILVGVKTYDYKFNENGYMEYSGKVNKQDVYMRYDYDKSFTKPTGSGSVSFFEELFGESLEENFYNYCPTMMMEGNNTMHIWYCSNKDSGNVTDYVAYRKGTLHSDGKWTFSEKKLVLSPTPNTWDYVHTCDPSVVKGEFRMGGEDYGYLMAYLGCATYNCTANEVGIAVAKKPEGPWVKVDSLNPIANFIQSEDYNAASWGYGQPSVISSDKKGKVLLFYTKGVTSGTYTYVEEWDFSDLDNAVKVRENKILDAGVVNANGGSDCINNADFAYDPHFNRLYCIKEDFPYPTDGGVDWITGSNVLLYVSLGENGFDSIFGEHRWNVCGNLSAATTGKFRNHNAGILTDGYGEIINPFKIPVIYTVSDKATSYPNWSHGGQWPALHTYRLYGHVFEIK